MGCGVLNPGSGEACTSLSSSIKGIVRPREKVGFHGGGGGGGPKSDLVWYDGAAEVHSWEYGLGVSGLVTRRDWKYRRR
jgi:hypothetical protein